MIHKIILLLLLHNLGVLCAAQAQEIKILGPTLPIDRGRYTQLQILGLSDQDLTKVSISVSPSEKTELMKWKDWFNQPILVFSAQNSGKYFIEITLNKWRLSSDAALTEAKQAQISIELLTEYDSLLQKLISSYPVRVGTCTVEVAGTVPFPPGPQPPPDPIPVPISGRKQITIIWERGELTPNQAHLMKELRANQYLREKKHLLQILDDEHPIALPLLSKLGAVTPPATPPAIIIQTIDATGASSAVLLVDSLPESSTVVQIVELLKKVGG